MFVFFDHPGRNGGLFRIQNHRAEIHIVGWRFRLAGRTPGIGGRLVTRETAGGVYGNVGSHGRTSWSEEVATALRRASAPVAA
jgi:hypothetical protein